MWCKFPFISPCDLVNKCTKLCFQSFWKGSVSHAWKNNALPFSLCLAEWFAVILVLLKPCCYICLFILFFLLLQWFGARRLEPCSSVGALSFPEVSGLEWSLINQRGRMTARWLVFSISPVEWNMVSKPATSQCKLPLCRCLWFCFTIWFCLLTYLTFVFIF